MSNTFYEGKIYKDKYYIIAGTKYYQSWDEWDFRIINGKLAQYGSNRVEVVKEFLFNGGKFRLGNGKLSKFQPITGSFPELYDWLNQNYRVLILNPELYNLNTKTGKAETKV